MNEGSRDPPPLKTAADLGDAQRLLLHRLVDRRTIVFTDGAELVDAADPAVGQHQRARFEVPLARVLDCCDSQAGAGRAHTRRRHRARAEAGGVLEELRFAGSWWVAGRRTRAPELTSALTRTERDDGPPPRGRSVNTGVPDQEKVDFSPDPHPRRVVARHTANQRERQRQLDNVQPKGLHADPSEELVAAWDEARPAPAVGVRRESDAATPGG